MQLREGPTALRWWTDADVPWLHAALQDAEILRWMPGMPRPYTMDDALRFVREEVGLGPHHFAVLDNGNLVGSVGMRIDHNRTGHAGYWCTVEARGRGVTTRALRILCRFGFAELGLGRLELVADPENLASQRVAEKAGFRREGVLRSHLLHPDGRRRDSIMYSLLPEELSE